MVQIPKKYQKALGNFAVMAVLVWFCLRIAPKIILLFMPFLVGVFLAWLANPIVGFLEKRCKIKRRTGSALVMIAVITGIGFFLYLIFNNLVKESQRAVKMIPGLWNKMKIEVVAVTKDGSRLIENLPSEIIVKIQEVGQVLEEEVTVMAGEMSLSAADTLANMASRIPSMIFAATISLLSAYFFSAEKKEIAAFFKRVIGESGRQKLWKLKQTTIDVMTEYGKAQLKIEIWIYLIVALGFLFLKVKYWYVLALLAAFFDILPMLGTGILLLPWTVFCLAKGDYGLALGLFVIWVVGLLVRQMIQPKMLGDSAGMSAISTLILLYVGYRLAGVAGMIGAVPVGMMVLSMNQAGFFENCKKSIFILWQGFREFCSFSEEDN